MPKLLQKPLFPAILCLIAASLPVQGAKPAGGFLSGVVLSTSGAPVPAANVFWQTADGKSPHALRTDKNGRFRTAAVSAGLYDLRAEADGMWSEWKHNVLVRAGAASNLTLRLVRRTPPAAKATYGDRRGS